MHFDNKIITSGCSEFGLVEKSIIYINKIIPNRVIENKQVYEITHLNKLYFISGFEVITENDKVRRVILHGYHPNRDDNGLYCLPSEKKNQPFTENYLNMLISNIKTYYLDSCYFRPPPDLLKYRRLKSIYFQLNQGE